MHADSAYVIGSTHKVCEDYARSGNGPDLAYALVSDGCSGSDDTDVGARILVNLTDKFIRERGWPGTSQPNVSSIIDSAALIQRSMGLDELALDATLLGIYVGVDTISYFGAGDGVIAIKMHSGKVRIIELEAPSGYPVYPSYLLNPPRMDQVKCHGPWLVAEYPHDSHLNNHDGAWQYPRHGCDVFDRHVVRTVDDDEDDWFESIAVFSDGVKSFLNEGGEEVPWVDVVKELMSFKGYKGEFAQRRLQGFLRKCKKQGWTHYDDVSMGAVYLGE